MAKRYYRPELDALRFFAFACVFLHHQTKTHRPWLRHIADTGELGMCIFFMLSAYLIVTILLREKDVTGTVSWKAFAARRILRIWPLYFATMFLIFGLGRYWPLAHLTWHEVIAFSVLIGNVYILRYGWGIGPIGPLWSISIEEQFYLAAPMIARVSSRRTMAAMCIATIVFAYVVLLWLGYRGASPRIGVWANSFVQFQFFAAGGLIALWLYESQQTLSAPARCCLAIGGLALWYFAMVHFQLSSGTPSNPTQLVCGYLLILIGTTTIFLSVFDLNRHVPRSLVYLGKISYGLYLFHELFIYLILESANLWPRMRFFQLHGAAATTLIFALTVATAALSYHFFERPILKFKERFETIHTRPA